MVEYKDEKYSIRGVTATFAEHCYMLGISYSHIVNPKTSWMIVRGFTGDLHYICTRLGISESEVLSKSSRGYSAVEAITSLLHEVN